MISYDQALQIIRTVGTPFNPRSVRLDHLLNTVTSSDVKSCMTVPSFRNSAMDGYAVRTVDVANASGDQPVTLEVHHSVAAGDKPSTGKEGTTCEIMTGAPVPEPYDAVIPVEDVKTASTGSGQNMRAQFSRAARTRENIRQPGEDFQQGQTIIAARVALNAGHIMSLAALGIDTLAVRSAPALLVLSTGKEVTDEYDKPLEQGKIFNSNSPYLLACAREEGFNAHYGGSIADDVAAFHKALDAAVPGSVMITTGAVSRGRFDFIPEALKERDATIHFHRVNIRPGKPIVFATLKDGGFFFGLPGNPISAAIGFRFFVIPLIRSLCGLNPTVPFNAQLENAYQKKGDFRQFLKARLNIGQDGMVRATIWENQESFKISPMITCNAWIVADEGKRELNKGDRLPAVPFSKYLVTEPDCI